MLSSQVLVNGLSSADQPILGVLKIWGAGTTKIIAATLVSDSRQHILTPQHNVDTQVWRDLFIYPPNTECSCYLLVLASVTVAWNYYSLIKITILGSLKAFSVFIKSLLASQESANVFPKDNNTLLSGLKLLQLMNQQYFWQRLFANQNSKFTLVLCSSASY